MTTCAPCPSLAPCLLPILLLLRPSPPQESYHTLAAKTRAFFLSVTHLYLGGPEHLEQYRHRWQHYEQHMPRWVVKADDDVWVWCAFVAWLRAHTWCIPACTAHMHDAGAACLPAHACLGSMVRATQHLLATFACFT